MSNFTNQIKTLLTNLLDEYDLNELDEDDINSCCEDKNIIFNWGATRFCFTMNGFPYVIKMMNFLETDYDYSADECDLYDKAKEFGVENLLLPIRMIDTFYHNKVGTIFLYKQNKVDNLLSDCSHAENDKIIKECNAQEMFDILSNDKWSDLRKNCVAWMLKKYPFEVVKRFVQWKNACDVYDLHCANIGFVEDKPVVIDYAPYNDEHDIGGSC